MKNYYRVMLGKGSKHAAECFSGNFIGADFDIHQDLSGKLPDDWRAFNKEFIPVFLADHPDKIEDRRRSQMRVLMDGCKGHQEWGCSALPRWDRALSSGRSQR
jgi:hypothetical protein